MAAAVPARIRMAKILAVMAALALGLLFAGGASAQQGFAGEGSGTATVTFSGDGGQADITVEWEGLAPEIPDLSGTDFADLSNMPFPHAQHIHAGTQGTCPTPDADADGNGVVDTLEGVPAYGPVVTSLTMDPADFQPAATLDVGNFPAGGSSSYTRTIDLAYDAETDAGAFNAAEQVRSGNAVIVVHGLNPAIMPGETALEVSSLSDSLPLAATAPALCGALEESGEGTFTATLSPVNPVASQVEAVPEGAVAAGGGSTAGAALPSWPVLVTALGLAGVAGVGTTLLARRAMR